MRYFIILVRTCIIKWLTPGENVEKLDPPHALDSVYMFLLLFYGKEYKHLPNLTTKTELLFWSTNGYVPKLLK